MAITLGVDVGHATIKAVAVSTGRTPTVLWTARVPREGAEGAQLVERLKRLRQNAKGPFDSVVTALSSEMGSIVIFPMPFSNPKLIEKTLAVELEGYVPGSLEGQHVTHQIIATRKGGATVAAAWAPVEQAREVLDRLTEAGLEPRILDLDALALGTCAAALDASPEPHAVVDVGARSTRVVVLAGDQLRAVRVIPAGGDSLTQALATALGIDGAAAETRKLEVLTRLGAGPLAEPPSSATDAVAQLTLSRGYEALAEDLAITLRAIEHKESFAIERVWLVGGASRAPGFDHLLQKRTGAPCDVLRPAEGANADPEWWSPDGAVAYGLALRGSRGIKGSALNFRHGELAYGRDIRELTRRAAPIAGPLAAVLIAGLVSLTVRYVSLSSDASKVRGAVVEAFRAQFPNVPVQDPEAQIRREIQTIDKKLGVLATPVAPAEVLRALSAATPSELAIKLDGMTLEGQRATIEGRTDRFETIDKLKTALANTQPFGEVRVQDQAKEGPEVRFTIVLEFAQGADQEVS